jgi:hypothetical protein
MQDEPPHEFHLYNDNLGVYFWAISIKDVSALSNFQSAVRMGPNRTQSSLSRIVGSRIKIGQRVY